MIAYAGFKAYLPAFWALPSIFLTSTAAAGSIGLINSVGNLGGFMGPYVLGKVEKVTGSFEGGLFFLVACMSLSAFIVSRLKLGGDYRERPEPAQSAGSVTAGSTEAARLAGSVKGGPLRS
jgi:ACS family tartrate transporter-like MFS transporter